MKLCGKHKMELNNFNLFDISVTWEGIPIYIFKPSEFLFLIVCFVQFSWCHMEKKN